MALIDVVDGTGKTCKVLVCDYCRTVCIPSGRFCSGSCARKYDEFCVIRSKPVEELRTETPAPR